PCFSAASATQDQSFRRTPEVSLRADRPACPRRSRPRPAAPSRIRIRRSFSSFQAATPGGKAPAESRVRGARHLFCTARPHMKKQRPSRPRHPPRAPRSPRPLPGGIEIVHEDDDVIVVDKPCGLNTVAPPGQGGRNLFGELKDYVRGRARRRG